jgi:hypothetical protein
MNSNDHFSLHQLSRTGIRCSADGTLRATPRLAVLKEMKSMLQPNAEF